jgi:hypothetical protein
MDKWTILISSRLVRITSSATTLVVAATIAGAGWKWN